MEDKKEIALEVPVQEQCDDKCKQCKELNKALDIMRTLQWRANDNYLSGLKYDRENETILIDEESLMRAIQLANPTQKHRKLRLITREEHKKLKTGEKEEVTPEVQVQEQQLKLYEAHMKEMKIVKIICILACLTICSIIIFIGLKFSN